MASFLNSGEGRMAAAVRTASSAASRWPICVLRFSARACASDAFQSRSVASVSACSARA